jgi:hypothetical protein
MNKNGNLLFVGIAGSGKSSFIAALWHVVDSKELDDSLKIKSLPKQREYLNGLRTAWLKCEKLPRNVGDFTNEVTLNLTLDSGDEIDLLFPDLAGEMFESHFANRQMKEDFAQKLKSVSNIVLFINPDSIKRGNLISDAAFVQEIDVQGIGEASPALDSSEGNREPEIPWEPKFAPTQVVLVDLLQMILEFVEKPKIAVIVSAWDIVLNLPDGDSTKKYPTEWLKITLPLLYQFLESNVDILKYQTFGVSAQGGDYEGERKQLQDEDIPSERIKVQLESGEIFKDISLPIKWILDAEA